VGETWKSVIGYEGIYEVSSLGSVRSLDRPGEPGKGLYARKGRVLTAVANWAGYHRVLLYKRGRRKLRLVHHLVLEAFVGARPEGMDGCHENGIRDDNRVENLRWDTKSGNMKDKVRHGTHHEVNKTHCPQGHEYTKDNTSRQNGARRCKTCNRDRARAWRVLNPGRHPKQLEGAQR
jgi:hypothetical protein